MTLISVGVDNGLRGAVTAIDDSFNVIGWWDCPIIPGGTKGKDQFHPSEMKKILQGIVNTFDAGCSSLRIQVWLEKAQSMPKQGVSSTFKTGQGAGLWEGIVVGMGLSYDIVHPKTWTTKVLADVPRGDPKQRSFIKCQRLFPDIPLKSGPRAKGPNMDGRSDSSLIAYYGMLTMKGQPGPKKLGRRTPVKRKK